MKAPVTFQRALVEQLVAIRMATACVCAGEMEALHVWRVAVRRLRTLLRVLPRKRSGWAPGAGRRSTLAAVVVFYERAESRWRSR